jgi:hypothetical protein
MIIGRFCFLNGLKFQRSRTSLFALSLSKGHSVLVGERSELLNFCSHLKGVLEWKDSPFINQKEREAERE